MEQTIDLADFLQRFSTKVLWHFTGYNKTDDESYEILLSIAINQVLEISERKPIIKMPSEKPRVGFKCSCMCDIPFKDLRIHTIRYGHFGIAFFKPNAILSGFFNPVLYMHKDHFLFKKSEKLINELEKLSNPHKELSQAFQQFLHILGTYVKSSDLLSKIQLDLSLDEEQKNNYYYEREWRSAYDWNFKSDDIAAIMLPQKYMNNFKNKIGDKFDNVSILSTEMVEAL